MAKRKTHEEFVEEISKKSPHIKIIGQYNGVKNRVDAKCLIHNYSWSPFANNLCQGKGYPLCGINKSSKTQTKTHEDFIKEVGLVNPDIEIIGTYKKYSEKIDSKCKICGTIFSVRAGHLLEGQGCPNCRRKSITKTHEEFLEELYIKNYKSYTFDILEKYKTSHTKLLCKCKICNNKWNAKPNLLLQGRGCPKCGRKTAGISKTLSDNEIKNRIKDINPNIEIIGEYTKLKEKIECKCLLCNNIWFPTPANLLKGSSCPLCSTSKGEEKIIDVLTNMNISFEPQKMFEGLLGVYGGKLSYDFYLPDYNMLIEFQGKQHYESIDWFGGNEKFEYQQEHDKRKREYAYKNNYNFLEIPYWDFDNIEDILKNIIYQESSNDGSFIM